jgi:methyltransferase
MFLLLLLALAVQRGLELLLASSNTAQLLRQGGKEVGASHYPILVLLHVSWFAALLWERSHGAQAGDARLVMLGWSLLLLGQGLRWWTITTLRRRWTTRIIVLPGLPPVQEGPFRLLSHPNYLGVWMEIVGVPMLGGCWRSALIMGVLHAGFLVWRKGLESRALMGGGDS